MNLKTLIDQANLGYVNEWATNDNFPITSDPKKPMELWQPPQTMTGEVVLEQFKNDGYEPGKIEHIVQYAIDHPKNDEGINWIAALGSTYRDSGGNLRVPCLYWDDKQWILEFAWHDSGWHDSGRIVRCKSDLGTSDTRPLAEPRTLGHSEKIDKPGTLMATDVTLRDYFASAALQAIIQTKHAFKNPNGETHNTMTPNIAAGIAFQFADAMLTERSKS